MNDRSWKSIISETRSSVFVGRRDKLEQCLTCLEDDEARFVYLSGIGGIGKTSLMRECQRQLEARGWQTLWRDAATVGDSTSMAEADFEAIADSLDASHALLLLDNFEQLAIPQSWLRDKMLPRLGSNIWVLAAGRNKLEPDWSVDPAWTQLTESIELGPMEPAESKELLLKRGVAESLAADIVASSRGLPIALALAAENAIHGTEDAGFLSTDDLQQLLEQLTDRHLTPDQRTALRVAGLTWVTTEDLLETVAEQGDASRLMRWLADRPYMQFTDEGLQPHPVIREYIDEHFRKTAPARRDRLRSRLADYFFDLIQANEQSAGAGYGFQLYFMMRSERGVSQLNLERSESLYVDRPTPDDRVVERVAEFDGPDSALIAEHWLNEQRDLAFVLRNKAGAMRGFAQIVPLEECDDEDRVLDPAVDLALTELDELSDLREGETARMARFWFDARAHQEPSPIQERIFMLFRRMLAHASGASHGPIVMRDPEKWRRRKDSLLRELGEFELDGHDFAVFSRDWRRFDAVEHLRLRLQVALTGDAPTEQVQARYDVLSRDEFADAVRDALKNYHRGDRLLANPLTRCRVIAAPPLKDPTASETEARIREQLRTSVESLGESGEDRLHRRILRKTFLEPSAKQRAVADDLAMSFGTYRRKLSDAVERVTRRLWERELQRPQ